MPVSLDKGVKRLIEETIDNFEKWDAIVFFHAHRDRLVLPEDVANTIGRSYKATEKSLEELSKAGVLGRMKRGDKQGYYYEPDERWAESIDKFMSCLDEKISRLNAFSYFIRQITG